MKTTLSPTAPADAVKKVLTDMGKSTAPESGVTVRDMTVAVDGGSIPVHNIDTPEGMGAVVPKAKDAEQYAADALKKAFAARH